MTIGFFSIILNNHQANLADEMYKLIGKDFVFVELENLSGDDKKGSTDDYSTRPYLLQSWKDEASATKAMEIAMNYDVCLFDGGFNYQKVRMTTGKMTFEFSERWLKGPKNFLSPRLWKNIISYHLNGWSKKPLYKLCASAYAAHDQHLLGTFKNKCYKFGYFTNIPENINFEPLNLEPAKGIEPSERGVRLMWCARFIDWKHPEMPIELARRLKVKGLRFKVDMYGDGQLREEMEHLAEGYGLNVCSLKNYEAKSNEQVNSINHKLSTINYDVEFHGNRPNNEVQQAMRENDIFLFTSDKGEGWGAVANEAMSNVCCLVGSNEIGAVPYLIKVDGSRFKVNGNTNSSGIYENGAIFKSKDINDLTEKVEWLINHPSEMHQMQIKAYETMRDVWSPKNAARSFLQLVDDLCHGKETSILEGPCSIA